MVHLRSRLQTRVQRDGQILSTDNQTEIKEQGRVKRFSRVRAQQSSPRTSQSHTQNNTHSQIFIAQCVAQPLMYLPTFYICKEVIMGDYEYLRLQDWKHASYVAMKKYAGTFWIDNVGMLSFWVPADIVIYSVPIWIRLPLSHTISFIWTAVLSAYRGEYN